MFRSQSHLLNVSLEFASSDTNRCLPSAYIRPLRLWRYSPAAGTMHGRSLAHIRWRRRHWDNRRICLSAAKEHCLPTILREARVAAEREAVRYSRQGNNSSLCNLMLPHWPVHEWLIKILSAFTDFQSSSSETDRKYTASNISVFFPFVSQRKHSPHHHHHHHILGWTWRCGVNVHEVFSGASGFPHI